MSLREILGLHSEEMADASKNLHSGTQRGAGGSLVETVAEAKPAIVGRSLRDRYSSKLLPDIDRSASILQLVDKKVSIKSTSNAVMDVETAGQITAGFLKAAGIPVFLHETWIHGMLICMAQNSASKRVPGRASFSIEWQTDEEAKAGKDPLKCVTHFFNDVIMVLGDDARRYFRAYAPVTREVLTDLRGKVQKGPKSDDEADYEAWLELLSQWQDVVRVAEDRGLGRDPTLAFDSAEFVQDLTVEERTMLRNSKDAVLPSVAERNGVDNPVIRRAKGENRVGAVDDAGEY